MENMCCNVMSLVELGNFFDERFHGVILWRTYAVTLCILLLQVNPLGEKYTDVQYIVVDPSCSGSGIVNRMDGIIDEKEDKLKEEV